MQNEETSYLDKLSIERAELYATSEGENLFGRTCRQLADTMRENERLRNLVEAFHHDTMYKDNPGLHDLAIELLQPSKPTVPCTSCGKPMEDRGASKQWCKECSSKIAEGE